MMENIKNSLDLLCDKHDEQDQKLLLLASLVEQKFDEVNTNTEKLQKSIDELKNTIDNVNTKFITLGESVTTCPVYMDRKYFELLASILRHPKIFILAFIGLASIVAGLVGTELYNLLVDLLCK